MKKIRSCLILCMILVFMCANTVGVFAHEIFYDGTTPVPIIWGDVTLSVANLKMNGELIDGDGIFNYVKARDSWNDTSENVSSPKSMVAKFSNTRKYNDMYSVLPNPFANNKSVTLDGISLY